MLTVVGVENIGDICCTVACIHRSFVVTGYNDISVSSCSLPLIPDNSRTVKTLQIKSTPGPCAPEPDVIRVLGVASWNGAIVCNGEDLLSTGPDTTSTLKFLGVASETYINCHIKAWNLPRVRVIQPRVGTMRIRIRRFAWADS